MDELSRICVAAERYQRDGHKAAMATVVAVKGSAYRRPGARMIVAEDGRSVGMIGGGCFDADVKETAQEVMDTGISQLRLYNMADDQIWGLGLGCNGSVYVLIESLTTEQGQEWLQQIRKILETRSVLRIEHRFSQPLHFQYSHNSHHVYVERTYQEVDAPLNREGKRSLDDWFEEFIEPAPRLLIFGAGHDVIPVVEFAAQAGFEVTVIDQRRQFLTYDRFPLASGFIHAYVEEYQSKIAFHADDYVLFMTHRIEADAEAFRACYPHPLRYVGFLGPKRRAQTIIQEMAKIDIPSLARIKHRIFAPIGLDMGAETAEQVALSIISELLAVKNQRMAISLRDKHGNIHDPSHLTERKKGESL